MTAPVLRVEDLTVSFSAGAGRAVAVDGLSYELRQGETLAIVGESGSGKSVSSLALLGLLPRRSARVERGRAEFSGRDLLTLPEREQRALRGNQIAMIFQEPMTSLTPVLRIGLQLTEALVAHGKLSGRQAYERAVEMLALVGLDQPRVRMGQFPHQLSGGMRQRVMIAMAMINEPAILIADEPTTALDVTVQSQILDLMRDLKTRFGTAIILITHDMGVVAEMADRVVVMRSGRKVEEGAARTVFQAPEADYTKRLLAAVPRLGAFQAEPAPRQVVESAAPVGEPLLRASHMTKVFGAGGLWFGRGRGTKAMDDVSLELKSAETLALVGESGSGKSTTGRAILRMVDVDEGTIHMAGTDVRALSAAGLRRLRRDMQMIFQDPFAALNPRMSAGALVAEPMRIHQVAEGSHLSDKVGELFRRVGLETDHIRRFPHEFSGGQRQRLCIARALGVEPQIIVADEPTSALDVSVQAQVLELMLELQQTYGLAYLFISHDVAVVEEMSHRVAVMHRGRIVEMGARQAVIGAPQHPYTKALLAAVPTPDPTRVRGALPVLDVEGMARGPLEEVAPGHFVAQ
ncbi:MAG: ABC transporter ATP-binding protein [Pseudomonadota bacterium]